MNFTTEYFASLFRDLTNRIYTFSAVVFVAELSGSHSTPVSIFDLEVEGLTLGIIQAGAFLALAQAIASLAIALFAMDKASMEKAFRDATSSDENETLFKNPVYARLRESIQRKATLAKLFYNIFHMLLPMSVGILAMLWSFPDLCKVIASFPGAEFRLCED